MNAEIQAILSRYDLPNNVLLGDLSGHLTGDELARVHYLLKYPNEKTEPKGGRIGMNKEEMIDEIVTLCNVNRDNPYCSVHWLADSIKEIVEGKSYLGDLEEASDED